MSEEFMDRLQAMRDLVNYPVKITSGYRCPAHNAAEGGEDRSLHPFGRAVDIELPDGLIGYLFLSAALEAGFKGIGIKRKPGGGGFLHVDDRDGPCVIWTY